MAPVYVLMVCVLMVCCAALDRAGVWCVSIEEHCTVCLYVHHSCKFNWLLRLYTLPLTGTPSGPSFTHHHSVVVASVTSMQCVACSHLLYNSSAKAPLFLSVVACQFREDTAGWTLCACPRIACLLVQLCWKTPFQTWIQAMVGESSARQASRHCSLLTVL